MSAKQLKVVISFKQDTEKELYDFLRSKRNYSAYIKDLLEREIEGTNITTIIETVHDNKTKDLKNNNDNLSSNDVDDMLLGLIGEEGDN